VITQTFEYPLTAGDSPDGVRLRPNFKAAGAKPGRNSRIEKDVWIRTGSTTTLETPADNVLSGVSRGSRMEK